MDLAEQSEKLKDVISQDSAAALTEMPHRSVVTIYYQPQELFSSKK